MIGLDTNVLVRLLVGDDKKEFAAAKRAVSKMTPSEPSYLTIVTLVETFWVLTRGYKLAAGDALRTLTDVVDRDDVVVQDEPVIRHALRKADSGADFPDAVIMCTCTAAGAGSVLTFDRRAARSLGMTLLH